MKSVLVLDDHAADRELLSMVLDHAGYSVLTATSADEALRRARAQRPDLIITDLLMPEVNGYEFVRQLRADPVVGQTKVIFCTATYDEDEVRRLADAYSVTRVLIKPCEPQDVIRAVAGVLGAGVSGASSGLSSNQLDHEERHVINNKLFQTVSELQRMQADRLRSSMEAADAERRRWARELHDETLQGLGALRVLMSSALRRGDPEQLQVAMREAVGRVEQEIANLRSIISELRPAALDELGLRAAIAALLARHREQSGFEVDSRLELPDPASGEGRVADALETAVYRLVQEALSNVAKHARASRVHVTVRASGGEFFIQISDNGDGFEPDATGVGFGLAGMRERVDLTGGRLSIQSNGQGTVVSARLPVHGDGEAAMGGVGLRARQLPAPRSD